MQVGDSSMGEGLDPEVVVDADGWPTIFGDIIEGMKAMQDDDSWPSMAEGKEAMQDGNSLPSMAEGNEAWQDYDSLLSIKPINLRWSKTY